METMSSKRASRCRRKNRGPRPSGRRQQERKGVQTEGMARVQYSIVVPALNEERRIATTLDFLLQHFEDRIPRLEILVVDDGSTDRTSEVVLWYRRRTYRVKLLRIPHSGKGAAVRHGVTH